jgi:hypothetical protein
MAILTAIMAYMPLVCEHQLQSLHNHTHRNLRMTHKIRRKVRPVEHNTPPGIDGIAAHVHGGNNDRSKTVLFVPEDVVRPCKKGRLAGVHRASPIVHAKVDRSVLRVSKNQSTRDYPGYAYPVAN